MINQESLVGMLHQFLYFLVSSLYFFFQTVQSLMKIRLAGRIQFTQNFIDILSQDSRILCGVPDVRFHTMCVLVFLSVRMSVDFMNQINAFRHVVERQVRCICL